jgi:anti-sigma B factor antagonist
MLLTNAPSWGQATAPPSNGSRVAREGDRTVIWLSGEYDLANMTALADELAAAIDLEDADLVVDLTEVQFIDASTFGVLAQAQGLLLQRSRRLTLRNPTRFVRRIIDILGLAQLIDSAPSGGGPLDWFVRAG